MGTTLYEYFRVRAGAYVFAELGVEGEFLHQRLGRGHADRQRADAEH